MERETKEQIIVLLTVGSMILNAFTLLVTTYYNSLRVKHLQIMFTTLLILALLYSVNLFVQYLYHHSGEIFIWNNWCLAVLGMYLLTLFASCNVEILALFAPIAPFWSNERIRKLKLLEVCLHFILHLPCYIYPIIMFMEDSLLKRFLHSWYYAGVAAHAGIVSLFCTWEIVYLLLQIYHHLRSKRNQDIKIRISGMIRFGSMYAFLVLLDWFGVYLYLRPGDVFYRTIALAFLGFRVTILVLVFDQLRSLTFTKDQLFGQRRASHEPGKENHNGTPLSRIKFSKEVNSRTY
jgi:hypothetical protein